MSISLCQSWRQWPSRTGGGTLNSLLFIVFAGWIAAMLQCALPKAAEKTGGRTRLKRWSGRTDGLTLSRALCGVGGLLTDKGRKEGGMEGAKEGRDGRAEKVYLDAGWKFNRAWGRVSRGRLE